MEKMRAETEAKAREAIRRLDQTLGAHGFGSRKEIASLVRAGHVRINGVAAHSGGQKINLVRDGVTVRGESVGLLEHAYIMLHKPRGVISASRDANAPTVLELLPQGLRRRGLFPVGRLDKDTTGLLLVTDDGALAHSLLSPRRHVPKTYLVTLRAPAAREDAAAFAGGMRLPAAEGHPPESCMPAELFILEGNRARVVLREGKYHQIRRMFAALGNEVLALHREAVGGLRLDEGLPPGKCRELTIEEIENLKKIEAIPPSAPFV
jgi:16S rRNA pseudouridine516 synthase